MNVRHAIDSALARLRLGEGEQALAALRQVCVSAPQSLAAHNALGAALGTLGHTQQAEAAFVRALELQPGHAQVQTNLASLWLDAGAVVRSRAGFEHAIASGGAPVQAHLGLGHALLLLGESGAATQAFARASTLASGKPAIHSRRCYAALLDPALETRQLVALHRTYEAQLPSPATSSSSPPAREPGRNRRLRLGYVSADLREHSVASFFEGVLAAHDPGCVEVLLYADVSAPDATTQRFAERAAAFRSVAGMTDDALAAQIRADRVDVLIDLGGHMQPSRLPMFAQRPAPRLLTYLGYPGTTGLSVFSGRITDAWADPDEDPELAGPEPLLRVPHGYFAYHSPVDAPQVSALPALQSGHVTFGCFNAALKLNDRVLSAFAQVLGRVEGSRLLLKAEALSSADVRARVLRSLQAHGIADARVEVLPWAATRREHLACYARVDVALDTFPYAGATTSCEALYMGVPVISLAGDRHAARMGVSILSAVGLCDWIATSPAHYVELAHTHSSRLQSLAALRRCLRAQLQASPLGDATRIARFIESVCARG